MNEKRSNVIEMPRLISARLRLPDAKALIEEAAA